MSEAEYIAAVHRAIEKRDRIIAREGDADGQRMEPWYLDALITEELLQVTFERMFGASVVQMAIAP